MQLPTPAATATPLIPVGPTETPTSLVPTPTPTPEPMAYILENIKGAVLIIPAGSTKSEPAEEEQVVEAGDEVVTRDNSEASLTLNEMTMFHLSANSDVKVSELKPNASKGFISRLKLIAGKVLSEVEKLGESRSSFEIEAGGVVCGVRGTSFEVQVQRDQVSAYTFEGSVEMRREKLKQLVKANHRGAFSRKKKAFLSQRLLTSAEKKHYKDWSKTRNRIRQKRIDRTKLIQTLGLLPSEERARVKERLSQVDPRDRVRALHELLKERKREKQGGKSRIKTLLPGERPSVTSGAKSLRGKTQARKKAPLLKTKGRGRNRVTGKETQDRLKAAPRNPKPGRGVFDKDKKRKALKKKTRPKTEDAN